MLGAAAVLAGTALLLLALLWTLQRRLIYLPSPRAVPSAATVLGGAREVTLRTSDALERGAWWVVPGDRRPPMAVLVAPGNAGNRSQRAPLAAALARHGL